MGRPRSSPLSVPPAPPQAPPAPPPAGSTNPALAALQLLRAGARRLRRPAPEPAPSASAPPGGRPGPAGTDPLLAVGRQLREAREARGLGMRQLAQATRISIPVIEALERGWRDRLPEPTYLRVMLPLLEQQLELPAGSLAGALPASDRHAHGPQRQALLRRHTPGSIDVFTTWQGTLLYGLLTLLVLYGLNLQQRRLAAQGATSLTPLQPLPLAPRPSGSGSTDPVRASLLQAYPELQPLHRAAAGQGLALLRREQASNSPRTTAANQPAGLLRLRLSRPTSLLLQSRGGRTTLADLQGELSLPVLPPFELEIGAPAEGPVLWNGSALAPLGRRGEAVLYRWPPRP
jgi:transcriptional regulator with XRE-family HTH domain